MPGKSGWFSAWATPVQFLNDRAELRLGLEVLSNVAAAKPLSSLRVRTIIDNLRNSFGRLETDAFQMSFSGDPDELGQWRGYGDNGMGCSVVTRVNDVHAVADVTGWVIYDAKKQRAFAYKVLEGLRGERDDVVIEQKLVSAACFIKHEGFRSEREYRLLRFPNPSEVCFRESRERLVPYVDYLAGVRSLGISRIVVGPGWRLGSLDSTALAQHHVVQGIHRLLAARGLPPSIQPSGIPYDPR